MEKFEELKTLVSSLEEDATKFYEKSNKAAGTRLRKGCQEVKKSLSRYSCRSFTTKKCGNGICVKKSI